MNSEPHLNCGLSMWTETKKRGNKKTNPTPELSAKFWDDLETKLSLCPSTSAYRLTAVFCTELEAHTPAVRTLVHPNKHTL